MTGNEGPAPHDTTCVGGARAASLPLICWWGAGNLPNLRPEENNETKHYDEDWLSRSS